MVREPLVLLPGKFCDARVFSAQVVAFSRERPVIVGPTFFGDRVTEYAASLLEILPRQFAVLGHDLGGFVAMELLRKAPDRVCRFGLMGTSALAETPQDAAVRESAVIAIRSGRLMDVVEDEAMHALANRPERNGSLQLLTAMAQDIGVDTAIDHIRAIQRRPDQQGTLRKCKVPSVVICGDCDPLTPMKRHDFMAGMIPYAQLRVIENAGHYPSIEDPEATTAALREWLAQPYVLRAQA